MAICYIALGSNLDHPLAQVESAVKDIAQLGTVKKVSPWYQSRAIGPGEQDDYINGVLCLETALSPIALLAALQTIENQHGRVRSIRWGARTLDLDILLYGQQIIQQSDLEVPHPRLKERNFVVFPLHDIASNLQLPTGESLSTLRATLCHADITQLNN